MLTQKFTKKLASDLGVNNEKIYVINPGVKLSNRNKNEYDSEAIKKIFGNAFPRIVTIARLDKRKSHQNILMTIKNLKPKFPKIKYISIGRWRERNNLENLKKELKLNDEVNFFYKSNEQLKVAILKNCDLFLMPSSYI